MNGKADPPLLPVVVRILPLESTAKKAVTVPVNAPEPVYAGN